MTYRRKIVSSLCLSLAAVLGLGGVAEAANHYVSRNASGANDGTSWANAWNELARIDWSRVNPGDTVLIDGGSSGLTYRTTLTFGKSGTQGNPITVARATESGRNGRVTIFGGDPTPLPRNGASHPTPSGTIERGIDLRGRQYVTVDGRAWGGITVYGTRGRSGSNGGVDLSTASNNITMRYLRVFDCGFSDGRNEGKSVNIAGDRITIEYCLLHDSLQDVIQGRSLTNLTMRRTWLYNSRPHAQNMSTPFNTGRHHDGMQIYAGGAMPNYLIEDCIIGPNFNQAIFPSETGTYARNLTIRNTLFIGNVNSAQWQAVIDKDTTNTAKNWRFYNCTFWARYQGSEANHLLLSGTGHEVRGCIFYDGRMVSRHSTPAISDCMSYRIYSGPTYGLVQDPQFADISFRHLGSDPNSWPSPYTDFGHDWDFTPRNPNAGYGDGTNPRMGVDKTMVTVRAFLASGVSIGEVAPPPPATGPVCSVTSPAQGAHLEAGSPATFKASAASSATQVEFLLNGVSVGVAKSSPYQVTIPNLVKGKHVLTAAASDQSGVKGAPSSVAFNAVPRLTGSKWQATDGLILEPFQEESDGIVQDTTVLDPAQAGRALYRFEVSQAGSYAVRMAVNAPNESSNSLLLNIGNSQMSQSMVWDIPVTSGIEERMLAWRGSGTPEANELDPKVFSLEPGIYEMTIVGREANTMIQSVEMVPVAGTDPTDPTDPIDPVDPDQPTPINPIDLVQGCSAAPGQSSRAAVLGFGLFAFGQAVLRRMRRCAA